MPQVDSKTTLKVYKLIDRMAEAIGVDIPHEAYPKIFPTKGNSHYDITFNELVFNKKELQKGDIIGEEIGHFIRDYLLTKPRKEPGLFGRMLGAKPEEKKEQDTIYTSEFFGYLGRKILEQATKPEDKLTFKERVEPRKQAMEKLKRVRKDTKKWKEYEEEHPEETKKGVNALKEYKKALLLHQRPYEFAENIDLDQIDLKELYEMPTKEVRTRFFRTDPQYDLSKPPKEPKITKRKTTPKTLEQAVTTIAILILTLLALFSLKTLTGHIIRLFG